MLTSWRVSIFKHFLGLESYINPGFKMICFFSRHFVLGNSSSSQEAFLVHVEVIVGMLLVHVLYIIIATWYHLII